MFEQTFKNIDDLVWKEVGCTTELDYTEQTSWMLFLKYLDDPEHEKTMSAELLGKPYAFIPVPLPQRLQTSRDRPRHHRVSAGECDATSGLEFWPPEHRIAIVIGESVSS
jgi:hypothetical protein